MITEDEFGTEYEDDDTGHYEDETPIEALLAALGLVGVLAIVVAIAVLLS